MFHALTVQRGAGDAKYFLNERSVGLMDGSGNAPVALLLPPKTRLFPKERLTSSYVNTRYLYSLVNVRLDKDRLRKARICEAIDERLGQLNRSRKARDIQAIVDRIFEEYPDPAGLWPRAYDVYDPKAAGNAIVRKLRRRSQ